MGDIGEEAAGQRQPPPVLNSTRDDQAWQRFVAHRDDDAFAEVLRIYYGLVYSVCRRALNADHAAVEDAVQETFCKLAANAGKVRTNLAGWLHRCALNTARETIRRDQSRKRREQNWALEKDDVSNMDTVEITSDLDDAIASLDEADQRLILEHFIVGVSQTVLAQELGISPSGVSRRLSRALEQLRLKLAQIGVTVTASTLASSMASGTAEAAVSTEAIASVVKVALTKAGGSASPWAALFAASGKTAVKVWAGVVVALAVVSTGFLSSYFWSTPTTVPRGRLTIAGGHVGDSFGQVIAADGPHLLVGAPTDSSSSESLGAFYAFRREGGQWNQSQKILAPKGAGPAFGSAIAIDGDVVAIGPFGRLISPGSGSPIPTVRLSAPDRAMVHIYQYQDNRWSRAQTVTVENESVSSGFGAAVALDGEQLLVGAPYDDERGDGAGAVYAYERSGGDWSPTAKLTPPARQPRVGFGVGLAVGDGYAVVAAPGDREHGQLAGAAYVYQFVDGRWEPTQKLTAPDGRPGQRFGESIALNGDFLAIGAADRAAENKGPGQVYLFERDGNLWRHEQTLSPTQPSPGPEFGGTLALKAGMLVVGARFAASNEVAQAGAAYVFCRRWGKWRLSQVHQPTASERFAAFGDAVAASEEGVFVGCSGGYTTELSPDVGMRLLHQLQSGKTPSLPQLRNKPGRAFVFDVE